MRPPPSDSHTPAALAELRGVSRAAARMVAFGRASSYYAHRIHRRGLASMSVIASRKQILAPAMELPKTRPIIWESHLARILGAAAYSADQVIRRDLSDAPFVVRETAVYTIRQAVLLNGSLYCGTRRRDEFRNKLLPRPIDLQARSPVHEITGGSFAALECGSTWFGHWLEDEVPSLLLASRWGQPLGTYRPVYQQEHEYLDLFGIPEPIRAATAICHDLQWIDEPALQSPLKAKRCHYLRRRLSHIQGSAKRVFLMRGKTGARRCLVNEDAVVAQLACEGFVAVDPTAMTVAELAGAIRGADLFVSVEGSHLAHILYMAAPGAKMVIINPPHQVHTTVADCGLFFGLHSGMFIATPMGTSKTDFSVDIQELRHFIDYTCKQSAMREGVLAGFTARLFQLAAESDGDFWDVPSPIAEPMTKESLYS